MKYKIKKIYQKIVGFVLKIIISQTGQEINVALSNLPISVIMQTCQGIHGLDTIRQFFKPLNGIVIKKGEFRDVLSRFCLLGRLSMANPQEFFKNEL